MREISETYARNIIDILKLRDVDTSKKLYASLITRNVSELESIYRVISAYSDLLRNSNEKALLNVTNNLIDCIDNHGRVRQGLDVLVETECLCPLEKEPENLHSEGRDDPHKVHVKQYEGRLLEGKEE